MAVTKPQIDPYLFAWWFVKFKKFVEEKSNIAFDSFSNSISGTLDATPPADAQ
jgi:hypothetical protein